MDAEQKYIREAGYDVAEEFMESISDMDIRTGIKIAKFIQENIDDIPSNKLVSTILGGVVVDDDNDPITFALEIINNDSEYIILSDVKLISMDEYLDLLNLKLNIKSNEPRKSKSIKKNSRTGL
jgi:hypothetical protein|tara:strand:+ start:543 stop:914 length:372 start_codon:yes stop_codon:yes gene_type:complete